MFSKKKKAEEVSQAAEPKRSVAVIRTATHAIGVATAYVSDSYVTLSAQGTDYYYGDNMMVPAGKEDDVIAMLQWVKEERARWAAFAQSDRAEV